MASIKGLSLKSLKQHNAMDGIALNATLYMDNKKIGEIHDEGNGGGLWASIPNSVREEVEKRIKAHYEKNPATYNNEESFFEELVNLTENEKEFKKAIKKGYKLIVEIRFLKRVHTDEEFTKHVQNYKEDRVFYLPSEAHLVKVLEEHNPAEYTAYRSLDDFILE